MSVALTRPGTEPKITEEEKAVLTERLKTADEDAKNARNAYEFLAELHQKLRNTPSAPR